MGVTDFLWDVLRGSEEPGSARGSGRRDDAGIKMKGLGFHTGQRDSVLE